MNIRKELNKVYKGIQTLANKIEKLLPAAEAFAKAKPKIAKKTPSKKRMSRKSTVAKAGRKPAVKKVAKAKADRKTPAKKPAGQKTAGVQVSKKETGNTSGNLSSADLVCGIIKSKPGADAATLISETGFNQKKIYNILYRLKKQGKIKSDSRGHYTEA